MRLLAESQAQVNIQTEVHLHYVVLCLIIVGLWYILHGLTITHKPQLTIYVLGLLSAGVAVKFMFKCIQECTSVQ